MLKFNRYIAQYLLYALPAVVVCIVWTSFQSQSEILAMENAVLSFIWNVLSWNLILWFALLIYFLFALVFSRRFRELLLKRLACVRERDEREEQITGWASKAAFLSTLALLILLLFASVIDIRVTRLPAGQEIDGKSRTLSIGLGFQALDLSGREVAGEDGTIFSIHDLPLSKEGIVLAIILWQLGSYHYFARRRLRAG